MADEQNKRESAGLKQPFTSQPVFNAKFTVTNMKKALSLIAFLSFTLCSYSQQTETRNVGSFRGVKAGEGIDVYLKKGAQESVRVEVSGTGISNVITEISGDYLKIHMAEGRYNNSRTVKVYVTYVEVDRLSASSAANIYADGPISSKSLSLSSSSAGTIELSVDAESVSVSASSAGDIELKGKAKRVSIDASSAGEVDAYDLDAEEANASASSGADVKLSVTQKLDARASSGGSIRYRGSPAKTNTNSSSGGSVRKTS